jgi:hypothetical protein
MLATVCSSQVYSLSIVASGALGRLSADAEKEGGKSDT